MKKNLIVGQSGGPTAVINGSLYGVVTEAMRHTEEIDEIYGMINGIEGFLNGHMMDMRSLIETNELSPYSVQHPALTSGHVVTSFPKI